MFLYFRNKIFFPLSLECLTFLFCFYFCTMVLVLTLTEGNTFRDGAVFKKKKVNFKNKISVLLMYLFFLNWDGGGNW